MNIKTLFFIILLLGYNAIISAQDLFGVRIPQTNQGAECVQCENAFRQKPKEVQFSIQREGQLLYLTTSDADWFNVLFRDPKQDGFAIDIVSKSLYACNKAEIDPPAFGSIRGELLKPTYWSQIKGKFKKSGEERYRVKVGTVPAAMQKDTDLEFNIFFINDRNFCRYYRLFDLKAYRLELLDMGMYLDSLTYDHDIKTAGTDGEGFTLKYKTLEFTVPFEKNKAEYSAADIKPVYDSLHLTDFDIKTIDIKAYASVEGSLERNVELQEQRAKSIAKALQQFQKPTIETSVEASENWVEFLNDIKGTPHEQLSSLSKKEVKEKLAQPKLNTELEPILKNHRKAQIRLALQKKDVYRDQSEVQLFTLYKKSVQSDQIEEALAIQQTIFERVKGKEINPDRLKELEVPLQKKYRDLIVNTAAFQYMIDERYTMLTYQKLKELEKLIPKDKKVKYNLSAVKFKIWRYTIEPVKTEEFRKEIQALKNYGINRVLIDRMLINWHIVKSENLMRKGAYAEKDKMVSYIYSKYKSVPLSEQDYLNLAQYFASFANVAYANELLEDKVQQLDADEDVLFYYLNLTLIDRKLTKTPEYRAMMLNAISKNQKRFCELFDPFGQGGVTFQLLEDHYLRETYCENCKSR